MPITVTTNGDAPGPCTAAPVSCPTLRAAIVEANTGASTSNNDVDIVIQPGVGTITLGSTLPYTGGAGGTHALTIRGSGATVRGDDTFPLIFNASSGSLTIDDLTLTVAIPENGTVVSGGETVDTDPTDAGPSPEAPVQTLLTVPATIVDPGVLTITSQAAGAPPAGFVLLGTEVVLEGPPASSATDPYVMTFSIDASLLGGLDPSAITVFRNGLAVAECDDPSSAVAAPDPCVAATGLIPEGDDGFVTVRTTSFSKWGFGLNKDVCKSNGWRELVLGHSFSDQGDCVSFVTTGGKNTAKA